MKTHIETLICSVIALLFFALPQLVLAQQLFYVANRGINSVSVVDVANGILVATIPVGEFPLAVAVNEIGDRAYVANSEDDSITVIDTTTNTVVTTIQLVIGGSNPNSLVVHPEGNPLYVANRFGGGKVAVIDTDTNTFMGSVDIGSGVFDIAIHPGGNDLFVTNSTDNTLYHVDTNTLTVIDTVPTGDSPRGVEVHPSGNAVFVANAMDNTISVFEFNNTPPSSRTTVLGNNGDLGPGITFPVGQDPTGITIPPGGGRVFGFNSNGDTISRLDISEPSTPFTGLENGADIIIGMENDRRRVDSGDILRGGFSRDVLEGGPGNDRLVGGDTERDELDVIDIDGGVGSDEFDVVDLLTGADPSLRGDVPGNFLAPAVPPQGDRFDFLNPNNFQVDEIQGTPFNVGSESFLASEPLASARRGNEPSNSSNRQLAANGDAVQYRFFYRAGYGTPAYASNPWVLARDFDPSNGATLNFPSEDNYVVVGHLVNDPTTIPTAIPIMGMNVNLGADAGDVVISRITANLPKGTPRAGEFVTFIVRADGPETRQYRFYYKAGYGTPAFDTNPWVLFKNFSDDNYATVAFPGADNYVVVAHVVADPSNIPAALPIIGMNVVVVEGVAVEG